MNRKVLLNIIKVILFLLFLSTCWMIYSTSQNMKEGFAPAKCAELGDCTACAGVKTSTDGVCAWDSKTGVCRVPAAGDDANYVSILNQCSARTTNFATGYTAGKTPDNAIWTNPNFGCPVCPTLHSVTGGSRITTQVAN
jgi:hypothetical protein